MLLARLMGKSEVDFKENESIIYAILVLGAHEAFINDLQPYQLEKINYLLITQRKWLLNLYIYEFLNRFLANLKVFHFLYFLSVESVLWMICLKFR